MPIPPYIKNTPLDEKHLRRSYQTIFPKPKRLVLGSAAAPTASLHFTNRVFDKLDKKGIKKYFITLYVGLGTFAPINENNIRTKKLHAEYYEIDNKVYRFIDKSIQEGKKLVAVGTTSTRTIEAIAYRCYSGKRPNHSEGACPESNNDSGVVTSFLPRMTGSTNLFIFPPYQFKLVDCLITNFHLPKSSLMMLVEALLQYKKANRNLIDLYKIAIREKFRFYSFGDAMLII